MRMEANKRLRPKFQDFDHNENTLNCDLLGFTG